jgi:peroxiredoxin
MVALETQPAKIGIKAPPFRLMGVDGNVRSRDDVRGARGLLVMFICNHCPYVKATIDRIVSDAKQLQALGMGVVAIMSNDVIKYPDDSFENMKRFAAEKGMNFPYLLDETQEVARAYDAVCTPDFFGFNADLELQYRGRLDESWQLIIPDPKRELLLACTEIATTGRTTAKQFSSIGCSIKWKR